jgi:gluconate kinase
MPPTLLDSQFATLEPPADIPCFDIAATPDELVEQICQRLELTA